MIRTRAVLAPLAIAALVAIVAIAWAGRVSEGRKALVEADAALARGDLTDAILASRIAAEARCPGCTAPDEGYAKLAKIAEDAEARGDDVTAFAAWRATRAALLATAVTTTSSAQRTHADIEIARFAHRIDAAAVAAGATPTPAAAEERVRATLTETDVPGGETYALVGLGAVVFLAASARFALVKARRSGVDLALAAAGALTAVAGAALF
ncbi:MAG: hypothetical protein JWP87_2423 [Labilithrix sp.]|nr:hypothetical protein [Labilithrix sp.]